MRLHTEYKMKLWSAVFLALGLIGCQQNSPSVNGYAVINREGESFYIDQTEVTIGAFRDFILQTGYVTTSDSLGWSGVFATNQGGWIPVTQANWEKPLGQEIGADELPVTHVSYFDAVAYCSWKNGRLPTAEEWDAAAGEKITPGNVWEGPFPYHNSGKDGYLEEAAPVGQFEPNANGLYDMFGNVWEWTSSNSERSETGQFYANGQLIDESAMKGKIIKGGSFLCDENYCAGYIPSKYQITPEDSGMNHLGFRCVYDYRDLEPAGS